MTMLPSPADAIRRDGTVLGFDVGSRRIGVAVGSGFGTGARAIASSHSAAGIIRTEIPPGITALRLPQPPRTPPM